jgi:hypothetical protein
MNVLHKQDLLFLSDLETDRRRLPYLAQNAQEDILLEIKNKRYLYLILSLLL